MFSIFRRFIQRKLRSRIQLHIALLLTVIFSIAIITSWLTLRDSFDQFERNSITQDISRLELWLNKELEGIERFASDYAPWDDTYYFANGTNPQFLEDNFTPDVFENINIDIFAVINRAGELHHGIQQFNNGDDAIRFDNLTDEMERWLVQRPIISSAQQLSKAAFVQQLSKTVGVINFFEGTAVLIAASPILTSEFVGPSVGTLLLVRILDSNRIAADDPMNGRSWKLYTAEAGKATELGFTQLGDKLQFAKELVGINDEGMTVLSLNSEAQLQSQFNMAIRLNSLNLILMALASLLVLGFVLNRVVLNRLFFFSRRADEIRAGSDHTLRIPHDNRDELDQLAMTVNEMLDALQRTNHQLQYDALHDSLTGLGNRAQLDERLNYTLKLSHVDGEKFAVMIVDLDVFKDINDLHGHAAGDAVLAHVAGIISGWCKLADTAVRLGGDEFAIIRILSSGSLDELTEETNCLRELLFFNHQWEGELLKISASIGIAISDPKNSDETASELLRNADTALYRAKADGRNRVLFFTPDMRELLFERMTLMQELEDAINTNKLMVYFQPILDQHGKPYSIEALVRWNHPERGMIPPDVFIPIAEKSMLIARLDLWVMKTAAESLQRLRQYAPDLVVSVNCSARTLLDTDVTGCILSEMERLQLAPDTLNVELTETALARNETEMVPILERMVQNNIRIYLDDFGTGYSSLSRLNLLPFHYLKVDQSFVKRIEKGEDVITRTIIQMAKSLNKMVVVEGVETESQYKILKQLGADYLQGYLFSRPLPEDELIEWISQFDCGRAGEKLGEASVVTS